MKLNALHPGQQTALKRVLRELVKAGRLLKEGKRFTLPKSAVEVEAVKSEKVEGRVERRGGQKQRAPQFEKQKPTHERQKKRIEGTLKVHPNGFGFVHPSSGEGENIFVTPADAARALDNDKVVVELVEGRDGRTTGRIVDVRDRTRQFVVGEYRENKHGAFVQTDIGPVSVPKTQLARDGDAVKVRLGVGKRVLSPDDRLTGEVAGSLGKMGDMSVEVLGIAYAQGFNEEFPAEVMDEADAVETTVLEAEANEKGRRDLRAMGLVTIDGEDARDFDDAVWVTDHPKGYRLVVAIADVSHYVEDGDALDAEALRRATSVYLPGRVLPMLPERLSNGICSLKPDEDRLCMVADMVIDKAGVAVSSELYPAVMRSAARCTYEEVHAVLAGRDVPHRVKFRPLFEKLLELSKVLTKMRLDRGAIDFDINETRVELNEDGTPKRMARRERLESHRIVEECMLAANEAVARYFRERGVPTLSRYHAPPDEEKLAAFAALAGAYGLNVRQGPMSSKELNALLKQLVGHPEQRALNQLLLRSMMQAIYSSQNDGHYGLGADDYLHFTSPIRRYPDLIVHRLLRQIWAKERVDGDELEKKAVQSSERERAAMKVEREVVSFYSCLMLKDRVGEELPATVSSLAEGGFYAELDGLYIEGMVRPSGWKFDPGLYRGILAGGKVVKVGLPMVARIASVNLQARKIDLEIVALEGAPVKAQAPQVRRRFEPRESPRQERRSKGGKGRPHGKSHRRR
ncbi:MAG: VacB/RNase II family 3'-5' exoribonuclease [Myxococcaceae bacterium]|nr:VacB/RNase II family 3'-5' exoribonuclease [Myxococcaceae bacterium]